MVLDLTPIYDFMSLPVDQMAQRMMYLFGWMPVAVVFLWGAKEVWLSYIRRQYGKTFKFTLLAIDIPRGNTQSPKAVENIFTYVLGAHSTYNLIETYWEGKFLPSFSFEIVSIEGYTQFLIYTQSQFRNLIESAIYSQYPDAEITEVNDYTENAPRRFPDEEYDIWGGEFILTKSSAYPIKVYKEFEHQFGEPEVQFKDPMASLMDLSSSLRQGEQLWFQVLITPLGFDWMEIGDKEIKKILGEKVSAETWVDKLINLPLSWLGMLSDIIMGSEAVEKKEEKPETFRMMNLKPKEKNQIEAIQEKVSKLSFHTKIRMIYLAKKEIMNKPKVVNGFVGFIKQFANLDLNNIKPDMQTTVTTASYFFKESRLRDKKNRIMRNYRMRDDTAGKKPGIYNIEELASIWHFPIEAVVKAPLIQKAPGRKAEPPMTLPIVAEAAGDEIMTSAAQTELDDVFRLEGEIKNGMPGVLAAKKSEDEEITPAEPDDDIFKEEAEPAKWPAGAPNSAAEKKGSPPENLPLA
ncbi:MAG: hypothetical protein MUC28_01880 [Planctomycetes bacterium]|nr:hypothetical protein [Planctomycetota bacterium]